MTTENVCKICDNDEEWHRENNPRHSFVGKNSDGGMAQLGPRKEKEKTGAKGKVEIGLPSDPALRIALVNAGVLTLADIYVAEEQLRTAGTHGRGVVYESPGRRRPVMDGGAGTDIRVGDGGGTPGSVRDPGEVGPN